MEGTWPLDWLRARIAYEPLKLELFEAALTHRSAHGRNNERLEFLGDAVLNLVVAQRLFERHPHANEGDLSRLRARVVSAEPLAAMAQEIGLGDALRMGSGELKTGGFRRQSILADAFEALIGAIYLDRGLDAAREFVLGLLTPRIESAAEVADLKDAKTRLQEWLQGRSMPLPVYWVESVDGEPHAQHFHVRCEVATIGAHGSGAGSSRRRAEQEAAQQVLGQLVERERA
jgi:ribonuclease III